MTTPHVLLAAIIVAATFLPFRSFAYNGICAGRDVFIYENCSASFQIECRGRAKASRCLVENGSAINEVASDISMIDHQTQNGNQTTITVEIWRAQTTDTGYWSCTNMSGQATDLHVEISQLPKPYISQIGRSDQPSFICQAYCKNPLALIKTTYMNLITDGQSIVGRPLSPLIQEGSNKVLQHFAAFEVNGTFSCRLTMNPGPKSSCNGTTTQDSINSITLPSQPVTTNQGSRTSATKSSTVQTPNKPTNSATSPTKTENSSPISYSQPSSQSSDHQHLHSAIIATTVGVILLLVVVIILAVYKRGCRAPEKTPTQDIQTSVQDSTEHNQYGPPSLVPSTRQP